MSSPRPPANDTATELASLRTEVRRFKAVSITLAALLVAGLAAERVLDRKLLDEVRTFDRIVAERLDIVEPDGTRRLVLTSAAATPGPIIDGREGKRNFPFSGLMLYDGEGDEIGGYGSGSSPSGDLIVHTMGYGQSEALASFRKIGADGAASAGIFLSDQPPLSMPSREATRIDWSRIKIQNPDKATEIVLSDTRHRPRIRLRVDARDQARIEVLDPDGAVVFSAPEADAH